MAGVLKDMARVPARLAPATSSLTRARALRDNLDVLRRNSKRALALFGDSLRAAGAALPALLEWSALAAKAHQRDVDALRSERRGFRVLLRVRPVLSDVERASGIAVRILDTKSCAFRDSDEASRGSGSYAGSARRGDGATGAWRAFAFDRVFGPSSGQRDVYDALEGLAPRVARGGHVALLAYGQTGSGKTFSMQGAPSRPGISARLLRRLCALVKAKGPGSTLSLGMVEIYNETLIDLLGCASGGLGKGGVPASASAKKRGGGGGGGATVLDMRWVSGAVTLPGLAWRPVDDMAGALAVLAEGNSRRATAATNVHEHSSRSHLVVLAEIDRGDSTSASPLSASCACARRFA